MLLLSRLGVVSCGTMALTASYQPIIYFEESTQKKNFVDALDKITVSILSVLTLFPYHDFQGPDAIDWHVTVRKPGRRSSGSPGTNDAAGRAQNSSGFMSAERYVFLGGSQAAQRSLRPRKRRPPRRPQDPFVLVGPETAKRGLNHPPPGIPILVSVPGAVHSPKDDAGYAAGTVTFHETLTSTSFSPDPDDPATGSKRRRSQVNSGTQSRKRARREVRTPEQVADSCPPAFTTSLSHLSLDEFLYLTENYPIVLVT